MEAKTSFSHSHALCTQLRSIHIIQHNSTTQLHNKLARSHIYTHMTFRLFTHIALGALSLEHIHLSVPSCRTGRLPPGLQSSGSDHVPSGWTCFPTEQKHDKLRNNNCVVSLLLNPKTQWVFCIAFKADALSRHSYLAPCPNDLAFDNQKQVILGPARQAMWVCDTPLDSRII